MPAEFGANEPLTDHRETISNERNMILLFSSEASQHSKLAGYFRLHGSDPSGRIVAYAEPDLKSWSSNTWETGGNEGRMPAEQSSISLKKIVGLLRFHIQLSKSFDYRESTSPAPND